MSTISSLSNFNLDKGFHIVDLGFQQFTQFANTVASVRHLYPKCKPIAFEVGTTAPEMMLLP
jgi:hypothetical protein